MKKPAAFTCCVHYGLIMGQLSIHYGLNSLVRIFWRSVIESTLWLHIYTYCEFRLKWPLFQQKNVVKMRPFQSKFAVKSIFLQHFYNISTIFELFQVRSNWLPLFLPVWILYYIIIINYIILFLRSTAVPFNITALLYILKTQDYNISSDAPHDPIDQGQFLPVRIFLRYAACTRTEKELDKKENEGFVLKIE